MTNEDFFRGRFEDMIDLGHPLAVLARRMPWEQIEGRWHRRRRIAIGPARSQKVPTRSVGTRAPEQE